MPLAAGVLAATCLGKVAPITASVQSAFGLTATLLGAAISVITFVTAALAAPAGEWLRHRDLTRWLATGLLVLAAAGVAMTVVSSPAVLIGLRLAEGVGYLLVMVGGPVLLVRRVPPRLRPLALALWGGCIPAGLALGAAAGGVIGSRWGWQWWFAVVAIACLGVALITLVAPSAAEHAEPEPAPAPAPEGRSRGFRDGWAGPLLLAAGFSAVALVNVAVLSLFPTYLSAELGMPTATAGFLTSVAAVASVPGTVCAGMLLRRGMRARVLVRTALLSAPLAVPMFAPRVHPGVTIAGAVLLMFTIGIAVAAAYGSLPLVVRHTGELSLANGILVQLGSAGTLVGPPLFAAVTGFRHWQLVPYLVLLAAGAGVLLVSRATTSRPTFASSTKPLRRSTRERGRRW